MATQILAVGTTALDSSDVVVTAAGLTVALMDADGGRIDAAALVYISLKDSNGFYTRVDGLDAVKPGVFIAAPGTYRFSRVAGGSCGVFSG